MTGVVVQAFVGERFHGTYRRYNGDRHVFHIVAGYPFLLWLTLRLFFKGFLHLLVAAS